MTSATNVMMRAGRVLGRLLIDTIMVICFLAVAEKHPSKHSHHT